MSPTTAAAAPRRRATTVAEARVRLGRVQTAEGIARAAAFRPRPDDVVIATFPKSGTTWMQQIVHGLRSNGSMDFEEITSVVPWIEMAHDLGQDLDRDQMARPRAFKTHLPRPMAPQGGRTICVVRDPRDVAISHYHFFEGYIFDGTDISLERFIREFILEAPPGEDYWSHVSGWLWWARREPVLVVFYEDMVDDLPAVVERVAGFIDAMPAACDLATRQARFPFMKAHVDQFDDHLIRHARHEALELPPEGDTPKVFEGRVGAHREVLSREVLAEFDRLFAQRMAPRLGVESYRDLRRALGAAALLEDAPGA